jgi:SAM-dependent methyltransferase
MTTDPQSPPPASNPPISGEEVGNSIDRAAYAIDQDRWDKAQAYEISFWRREGVLEYQLSRVAKRYGPIIAEVDTRLSGDIRILDVGCGPTCTARLFSKGRKTYLDPLMYSYELSWPDRMPEGERIAGIGEQIPHRTNTFDIVVSFNSLDHMFNPRDVLVEIRRVLKPGGVFLLGVFCHPPIFAYSRRGIEKVLPFLKDTPHPFSFTRGAVEHLVKKYFTVKESRCVYRKSGFLSPLHRTDWVLVCENRKPG